MDGHIFDGMTVPIPFALIESRTSYAAWINVTVWKSQGFVASVFSATINWLVVGSSLYGVLCIKCTIEMHLFAPSDHTRSTHPSIANFQSN